MKHILVLLVLLSLVMSKEPVKVTLLVEAEEDEGDDYLEIKLTISKQDESLTKALSESERLLGDITARTRQFCEQDSKNKDCKDATSAQDFQVETKYQIVRKESTFQHFIVKREITIKVYKTDTVGALVDQLQKMGVTKFDDFTWKNNDQEGEEEIVINNAKERAETLCQAFDYKFQRITEVTQKAPQQQKETKEDSGDDDKEDKPNVYQVVVQCIPSVKGKK